MSNQENLLKSMKTTAASRFIAASRLSARDRRLTRVTAFTSAYLILLTIFPYFFKLPTSVVDILNLITVALSVVVLVSSLLQYSSGDIVNAEQHHRSALEINEKRRLLAAATPNLSTADLEKFVDQYNSILQKYSVNHEEIDYLKYQIDRPDEFPWLSKFQRGWISSRLLFSNHSATLILALITFFIAFLLIFYAYPNHITSTEQPKATDQNKSKQSIG